MVRRKEECKFSVREAMRGGPGQVEQTECVFKDEMYEKARLFGVLTLKENCGIGYHVHENESELFYVISGTVTYNDNGTETELSAGDVAVCKDGEGHAVTNKSKEPAQIMAAIILK